jgi:hypothetical protein
MRREIQAHRTGLAAAAQPVGASPPPTPTPPPHSAPSGVFHLAPQEHVSVGSDGRFLDEAAPKSVTISLADCTLTFSIMYKRVTPAAKTSQPPTSQPPAAQPPAAAADHLTVKPRRFPETCSFRVLADRPFAHSDCLGAHVRICNDPALLHIGSEFEICAADAANRFGQVVFCSQPSAAAASGTAAVCTVHIKVDNTDMVYLPCSPLVVHATLSEVYRVIVQGSPELESEIASRTAAAAAAAFRDAKRRSIDISNLKQRAVQGMDAEVDLAVDELGAVLLRDGFLISQPLVSACMRELIKKWYPVTYEDECVGAFGSQEGPWSIRNVFNSLSKSRLRPKLLEEFGFVGAADSHGDPLRRRLEDIMDRCCLCCCTV